MNILKLQLRNDLERAIQISATIDASLSHNEQEIVRLTEIGDKLRHEFRIAKMNEISIKEQVDSLIDPDLKQVKEV